MSLSPQVLWAQRSNATDADKNIVYLTIKLADTENVKIDLTNTHLVFSATSNDKPYELNLEFFKAIDADKSKYEVTGSHIFFKLFKAEMQEEFWPRLIKEKLKLHYLKTDFDKWVDEDEQDEIKDEVAEPDMGGMPGAGMPGMGGAGGMDFASMMGGAGGAGGMPDFSSMMGGAGGADGAGGMDFAKLMSQMGGMGGEGGEGGFDMSKLAAMQEQLGAEGEDVENAEDAEDAE